MPITLPPVLQLSSLAPWVWMEISGQQTRVVCAQVGVPVQERVLSIGTGQLGNGPFRSVPPSALALENAIASVEDVVMPLVKVLPRQARFFASSEGLSATLGAQTLELAQLEDLFNDLAAYVQGRPFRTDDLIVQPGGAAQLLILREAMHHLGFDRVEVLQAER